MASTNFQIRGQHSIALVLYPQQVTPRPAYIYNKVNVSKVPALSYSLVSGCENGYLLGIGSVSALMSVPATINRQINNLQQEHFDAINCRPENLQRKCFLLRTTYV